MDSQVDIPPRSCRHDDIPPEVNLLPPHQYRRCFHYIDSVRDPKDALGLLKQAYLEVLQDKNAWHHRYSAALEDVNKLESSVADLSEKIAVVTKNHHIILDLFRELQEKTARAAQESSSEHPVVTIVETEEKTNETNETNDALEDLHWNSFHLL